MPIALDLRGRLKSYTFRSFLTARPIGQFDMMTQPFLKPGFLGPLPILLGEIFVTAGAAVRLALQQEELPVAYFASRTALVRHSFTRSARALKQSWAKIPIRGNSFSR